jgi:hypothetical protein
MNHIFSPHTEGFFSATNPDFTDVNTNLIFSTTGLNDCKAVINLVKGKSKDEVMSFFKLDSAGFLSNFNKIQEYLNTFTSTTSINTLAAASTLPGYENVKAYLTTLSTVQKPVLESINNCMIEYRDSITQDIYNKQKDDTTESKLRLDTMKSPEQNVSYFEGWFPIFRPMKESTLFTLFGTALALILGSIVFFLSLAGVSFNIILPGGGGLGGDEFGSGIPKGFLIGGIITGGAFAGLAAYKGWFQ